MAKRRPTQTVAEMEEEMGFRLSRLDETLLSGPTTSSGVLAPRLFSNLHTVSNDLRERTEKEHEEFIRGKRARETKSLFLKQKQIEVSFENYLWGQANNKMFSRP